MQFFKPLFGKAFSGFRQHQIVVGRSGFFLPAGVETGRVDGRHTRFIGISFRSDVQTTGARTSYQCHAIERLSAAAAVDVNHMEGSTCDRGGGDYLTDGFNVGAGLLLAITADMSV